MFDFTEPSPTSFFLMILTAAVVFVALVAVAYYIISLLHADARREGREISRQKQIAVEEYHAMLRDPAVAAACVANYMAEANSVNVQPAIVSCYEESPSDSYDDRRESCRAIDLPLTSTGELSVAGHYSPGLPMS